MSGHSKWATIKRKKGAADAKRGKLFTKLIREITVAARMGGGDPAGNPRLRSAVLAAKAANMPNANIERAIAKGAGAGEGDTYEEILYEGFAPGGVALLVEALTDNRNRAAAEVRSVFTKRGGNLGEPNSVRSLFDRKGHIVIDRNKVDEDTLMGIVLDAGAEDLRDEGAVFVVVSAPSEFYAVREAVTAAGIEPESAGVEWVPYSPVRVEGSAAQSLLRLIEALEDLDDVQNVYGNYELDEATLKSLEG